MYQGLTGQLVSSLLRRPFLVFLFYLFIFFVLTEFLEMNTNVLPTLHMETLWERFNGSVESQTSLS